MPFDVRDWCAAHPTDVRSSLFASLLKDSEQPSEQIDRSSAPQTTVRQALLAVDPGRRRRVILESYIQEQAAQVLRLSPSRIEPHKPLRALGFDSLMTLEFRNRLEQGLGLSLSATLVWNYPTVNDLVPYLAAKMEISLEATPQAAETVSPVEVASSSDLEQLSSGEIAALLDDELASVDQLLKNLPTGS